MIVFREFSTKPSSKYLITILKNFPKDKGTKTQKKTRTCPVFNIINYLIISQSTSVRSTICRNGDYSISLSELHLLCYVSQSLQEYLPGALCRHVRCLVRNSLCRMTLAPPVYAADKAPLSYNCRLCLRAL